MIRRKLLIATAIIASVVVTACSDMTAPAAGLAGRPSFDAASRPCPAPGTGLPGALNMLHDATMLTIPMARDADQGNAGMFHAVDVSGC
ncbi:MAG TPA: hypothetical protein VK573_12205 [Gemmatimonadales bacterium]|nr:hypothetical protein [Gemmatimonadales bacterium]